MADKIVAVPGIGNVSFPDTMPEDQINAAIRSSMGQQTATQQPRSAASLGNEALSKINPALAGTKVGQQPNVQMEQAGPLKNFFMNLGVAGEKLAGMLPGQAVGAAVTPEMYSAMGPVLKARLMTGGAQGATQNNPVSDVKGAASSLYHMIADPAAQVGSGDVSGGLGAAAVNYPVAGAIIKGGVDALRRGGDLIPSKARASEGFQQVAEAANTVPVDINTPGEVALRANELSKAGGQMPKVMRDFLRRVTDPEQGPMTYSEARDFYSNATRLSADEYGRLTPIMRAQAAQFADAMNRSIGEAAQSVQMGETYQGAMKEYAQASRNARLAKGAAKFIARATPYIGGAVAAGAAIKAGGGH